MNAVAKFRPQVLRVLFVVVVLVFGLWFGYLKSYKPHKTITESHTLYIDDIDSKTSDAADEFESAFASEPACRGMILLRWSTAKKSHSDFQFLEKPLWDLGVFDISSPDPNHPDLNFAVDLTPSHFNGLRVYSGPTTVQGAARAACFVTAGKGGK